MNKKLFIVLAVVVALLAGGGALLALTQKEDAQTKQNSTNTAPAPHSHDSTNHEHHHEVTEEATVNLDESKARTIKVEAGSYYFTPKEIRVKKGETIKIELTSKDMSHDFVIDELDFHVGADAGETSSGMFVANTAGEFTYYCSVSNHRPLGQVGKLIVEE